MISGPAIVAAGLTSALLVLPTGTAAAAAPPTCDGRTPTILGTAGDDALEGTAGPDVIVGLGGDDLIEAGAGDDVVCALAGADRIEGGPGADRLFGGIDRAWSDRGGENRVGDTVLPGPGDDYVDLGADRRPGTGYLERDTLVYRTVDQAISADLTPDAGRVEAEGTDTVRVHGQMGVVGSRFDDTIIGSPKGDTLSGGRGADVIEGRGGSDWLYPDYYDDEGRHQDDDVVRGGAGRDQLSSESGHDVLYGGPGEDFFDARTNPDIVVDAGPGDDGVSAVIGPSTPVELDGNGGNDYLFLEYSRQEGLPDGTVDMGTGLFTRAGLPEVPGRVARFEDLGLDGNARWTVHGTDAAEIISGAREVWAYGGDDEVYGTSGKDVVDAGAGNDRVWAYDGRDTCLNAERVRDCEIREAAARVAAVTCNGRPATIVGTAGNDRIKGTRGDDVIAGLDGNDRIEPLEGDDVVCGGPGDDEMTSYDQGRDVLVGGVGDDFVGSFENPNVRVRMGPGDDYASSQVGRVAGWSLDGGPGRDHLFLNLTLDLHEAGPMPGSLDLRARRLELRPDGRTVAGVLGDWEELDIPHSVEWRVHGTGADERFLFEGVIGIRVHAGAGDDEVIGTVRPDVIDGGAGEDTVTAYGGQDVCIRAEHTRGCETRERGARTGPLASRCPHRVAVTTRWWVVASSTPWDARG